MKKTISLSMKVMGIFSFSMLLLCISLVVMHYRDISRIESDRDSALRQINTIAWNGVFQKQRKTLDRNLTNLLNTDELVSFVSNPQNKTAKEILSGMFMGLSENHCVRMTIYDKGYNLLFQNVISCLPARSGNLPEYLFSTYKKSAEEFLNQYYFRGPEATGILFPTEYCGVTVVTDDDDNTIGFLELALDAGVWITDLSDLAKNSAALFDPSTREFSYATDVDLYGKIVNTIDVVDDQAVLNQIGDKYYYSDRLPIHDPQGNAVSWIWLTQDHTNQTKQARKNKIFGAVIILVVCSCTIGGSFIILQRKIIKPITKTVDFAKQMATGDFTGSLQFNQKDEIGTLAAAQNQMAIQLSGMIREISDKMDVLTKAGNEMNKVADMMAGNSETTVVQANSVAAAAEEMSVNMDSIAAAMTQATANINSISTTTTEMTTNIDSLSQDVGSAREDTKNVVQVVSESSVQVNELGKAAEKIGAVTESISAISDKTSLLALNATIEAARAGEAGKGFAVVANEIKNLSQQTADATTDIASKLKAIQQSAKITVEGIDEINNVIGQLDSVIAMITESMEQQSTATKEIAENVHQTSNGITEVHENINQTSTATSQVAEEITVVNKSATELNSGGGLVQQNATTLNEIAEELNNQLGMFKI